MQLHLLVQCRSLWWWIALFVGNCEDLSCVLLSHPSLSRAWIGLEINEAEDPEDFVAGDGRVMSQPTLLSLHVLWLREHNRIASRLKTTLDLHNFSDHAKDEVLFQVKLYFTLAPIPTRLSRLCSCARTWDTQKHLHNLRNFWQRQSLKASKLSKESRVLWNTMSPNFLAVKRDHPHFSTSFE